MQRSTFLKAATGAGLAAATGLPILSNTSALADGTPPKPTPLASAGQRLRGVNLGAWLVLEKWLIPSVFKGLKAEDEYTFCQELGGDAKKRLKQHHDTWITEADFAWIAAHGLNIVRLPVGYWVLDGDAPFIAAPDTLDRAFTRARQHGLRVLLDLHGAPGSQNGNDHSGRAGALEWPYKPENITRTLDAIEGLAKHCAKYDNLMGIELLNEPRWDVPIDTLKKYYQDGYQRVRSHVAPGVSVVIHDGFRPDAWNGFMQAPDYQNVLLDTHLYQCFTQEQNQQNIYEHLIHTAQDLKSQLDRMQKELPTFVGEWSAALASESLTGLTGFARDQAVRAYADAQFITYEASQGWIYWTYKAEYPTEWNFRDSAERGLLPSRYADS